MHATLIRVLILNALAIGFVQAHTLIDWHIDIGDAHD